jgi:hypothetical protein
MYIHVHCGPQRDERYVEDGQIEYSGVQAPPYILKGIGSILFLKYGLKKFADKTIKIM